MRPELLAYKLNDPYHIGKLSVQTDYAELKAQEYWDVNLNGIGGLQEYVQSFYVS